MSSLHEIETLVNQGWREHKQEALAVATAVLNMADEQRLPFDHDYYQRRAIRIMYCSRTLTRRECRRCGHVSELSNRCRDRMCPICQWRLSLDRFANLCQCNEWFFEKQGYLNAGMITLTVPTCTAEDLPKEVERILEAWHLLQMRRPIKRHIIGYARSIEIVRKKGQKFHPHLHAFVWFDKDYNKEIKTVDLASWWTAACGVDTKGDITKNYACDMRYAYDRKSRKKRDITSAEMTAIVAEASKYSMKAELISTAEPFEIVAIDHAIRGKRLVEYGRKIKEARKELKLVDEASDIETEVGGIPTCFACGSQDVIDLAMEWAVNRYRMADPIS